MGKRVGSRRRQARERREQEEAESKERHEAWMAERRLRDREQCARAEELAQRQREQALNLQERRLDLFDRLADLGFPCAVDPLTGRFMMNNGTLARLVETLEDKAETGAEADPHEAAMRLTDEALARLRDAAKLEAKAAKGAGDVEPSRSVLYRSASCLALQAEQASYALKLALEGLKGNPPAEIEAELKHAASTAWAAGGRSWETTKDVYANSMLSHLDRAEECAKQLKITDKDRFDGLRHWAKLARGDDPRQG